MTSRERVLTTLNHQVPDRFPIDLSGHRSSGIHWQTYIELRRKLGLPIQKVRVYDPIQQLAVVDTDILDLFQVDTIELGRGFSLEDKDWADWVTYDGVVCQMPSWANPERGDQEWIYRSNKGRIIAHKPDSALYFEQTYYPFQEKDDLDKIPDALTECMWATVCSPPSPDIRSRAQKATLQEGARRLRASTDRAILGLFGGNLLELGQMLYRNDNFLAMLVENPERAEDFLDRLVEMHLSNLEHYLSAVGPYIDIIVFGDDLGMQRGPQISPATYRRFFKPRHQRMWQRTKELANVKVMLHSCGGVRQLLPDLIEAGLDAINPVQISCRGMDARELKHEFAGRLVFWGGGCDTQVTLPVSSPEEIRRHVHEQIQILAPGGGFVFQQVHNIMAQVPPENVIAMYEACRDKC
jgi:uroporphyrinogen decarboxylase